MRNASYCIFEFRHLRTIQRFTEAGGLARGSRDNEHSPNHLSAFRLKGLKDQAGAPHELFRAPVQTA